LNSRATINFFRVSDAGQFNIGTLITTYVNSLMGEAGLTVLCPHASVIGMDSKSGVAHSNGDRFCPLSTAVALHGISTVTGRVPVASKINFC